MSLHSEFFAQVLSHVNLLEFFFRERLIFTYYAAQIQIALEYYQGVWVIISTV